METTSMLLDVRREEPDKGLFPGFKTNPTAAEMPYQFLTGKPAVPDPGP
ncbi:MAG TPA: hypothetical protein VKB24_07395 [Candidatus Acidoferrum sp.]|nr:hypothetical protein [Candidatus Acidoferrum sp.]